MKRNFLWHSKMADYARRPAYQNTDTAANFSVQEPCCKFGLSAAIHGHLELPPGVKLVASASLHSGRALHRKTKYWAVLMSFSGEADCLLLELICHLTGKSCSIYDNGVSGQECPNAMKIGLLTRRSTSISCWM